MAETLEALILDATQHFFVRNHRLKGSGHKDGAINRDRGDRDFNQNPLGEQGIGAVSKKRKE